MAYWGQENDAPPSIAVWQESLRSACRWIVETSLITTPAFPLDKSSFKFVDRFTDWRGAFRGEYHAGRKKWDVFCPIWHGGQGVKALVMAHQALGEPAYLEAARQAADFIVRHQVRDPIHPDCGLIYSYESGGGAHLNSSAILESLDGLFLLTQVTGDGQYQKCAIDALRWVQRAMFIEDQGLFRTEYDVEHRRAVEPPYMAKAGLLGRPLLDDGVYVTGYRLTGDESFKGVAVRTAERLLADEDPPGNWKRYPPANAETGVIHPRHAYWWGRPMWMIHELTGERRFLDAAIRSAQWYEKAMRLDGGLFRDTGPNFQTPSFGHATSGIACAAILWCELVQKTGDERWLAPMMRALRFCRGVQFTTAADPNLQGAILEKVLPPGGSDAPPWYLRDVGTFFYVQAVALVLREMPAVFEKIATQNH